MEVYEGVLTNSPVIIVRSVDRSKSSTNALIARKTFATGKTIIASIERVELESAEWYLGKRVVWFTCVWELGGKERGIICLDHRYTPSSFYITR